MRNALAVSGGFLGLRRLALAETLGATPAAPGYGPLLSDPHGILDLPAGFRYRVISRGGDAMNDGLRVPGLPDGMAAFPGPRGRVILVRNHELAALDKAIGAFGPDNSLLTPTFAARLYDTGDGATPSLGGTTTLIYDPQSGEVDEQFLSLAGTERNCAGGPTPWGSWVSCEESVDSAGTVEVVAGLDSAQISQTVVHAKDHGFTFEVRAAARASCARAQPLRAMGRFNHEAVAVDPRTGIVYQTEDRPDSLLYRFIPEHRGRLEGGGRLQALAIAGEPSRDTRNWSAAVLAELERMGMLAGVSAAAAFPVASALPVEWIDLEDVDGAQDDLRYRGLDKGAACFARGEGMWWGNDELYFACTFGGPLGAGQLFRYRPSPAEGSAGERGRAGQLELFVEARDRALLSNIDNLTVAPWGDVICCEDTDERGSGLLGVTMRGEVYRLADNLYTESELAGVCFSPDGRTLFVNIQADHRTLAITGPWQV